MTSPRRAEVKANEANFAERAKFWIIIIWLGKTTTPRDRLNEENCFAPYKVS